MANQENCVHVTRLAAKKRAAATAGESLQLQPLTKKRVVLGELSDISNVCSIQKSGSDLQKPISRSNNNVNNSLKTKQHDAELDDPQMSGAYVSEIYDYLRKMEIEPKRRPLPNYIEKIQNDVNVNMRGVLIDWLVEVADEYKLLPDTLYLTIYYIDRFLSMNALNRKKLQLLGVTSMLIASKYEEIHPPHVEDFCYITDNTYTKDDIVKMEAEVLKSLKFEMGNPTVKTFLRKFTQVAQEDEDYKVSYDSSLLESMGCYLAELSLLEYSCVKFLPSMVAASALFVARLTVRPNSNPWSLALQSYSGYKATDLKECVVIIHDLQWRKRLSTLEAVRQKYWHHQLKCVEARDCPPIIQDTFFDDTVE